MRYVFPITVVILPLVAGAQQNQPRNFAELVGVFLRIIDVLVPLVFALTFIVIVWGLTKAWIINPGDETEVTRGKNLAIVGVIALVLMSGIWGITAIIRTTFFGL